MKEENQMTFSQFAPRFAVVFPLLFSPNLSNGQQPDPTREDKSLAAMKLSVGPGDDELRKLLVARFNEVAAEFTELAKRATTTAEQEFDCLQRVLQATMEVSDGRPQERLRLLTHLKKQAMRLEKHWQDVQKKSGTGSTIQVRLHRATAFRLQVEISLLRLKTAMANKQ
jgi:hypothetical protein